MDTAEHGPATPPRPPFLRWFAYRFFDARLPYEHREWVRSDVLGRWYPLRSSLARSVQLFGIFVLVWVVMPLTSLAENDGYVFSSPGLLGSAIIAAGFLLNPLLSVILPRWGQGDRRRVLHRHDYLEDGTSFGAVPFSAPPS